MNTDELRKAAEAAVADGSSWYRLPRIEATLSSDPEGAAYIALANPQTVLALLDVVEAAKDVDTLALPPGADGMSFAFPLGKLRAALQRLAEL